MLYNFHKNKPNYGKIDGNSHNDSRFPDMLYEDTTSPGKTLSNDDFDI